MSGRRLVANLFFESELAGTRSTPTRKALERAAAYGSLMRVFAQEGDRLWLPAPLDPARMPEVSGLPEVVLESGTLSSLSPCAETLAWGESPAVAALRVSISPEPTDRRAAPTSVARRAVFAESGDLAEALWAIPPAPPSVAARVHHRAFALEVATSLGVALPGAAMLDSIEALERHLLAGAAPEGRWVVKAPLSASGRDRSLHRGPGEPVLRSRLERLFAVHGPLLFEPWMERTDDFGACALLAPEGLRLFGFHRLRVDPQGQFAGIEVDLDAPGAGLEPDEEALFDRTVEEAGAALAREGYTGPFGLDAWRYRDRAGAIHFHPLGEINARLTFGFVARALAEHQARDGGSGVSGMFGGSRRFRLEVNRGTPRFLPLNSL